MHKNLLFTAITPTQFLNHPSPRIIKRKIPDNLRKFRLDPRARFQKASFSRCLKSDFSLFHPLTTPPTRKIFCQGSTSTHKNLFQRKNFHRSNYSNSSSLSVLRPEGYLLKFFENFKRRQTPAMMGAGESKTHLPFPAYSIPVPRYTSVQSLPPS